MQRPLSQLVYTPFRETSGGRSIIILHRQNAFAASLRELGLGASPAGRVIGLQSSKGVYVGRSVVGYTWFLGPLEQPSPVHFGDSLSEIERFLWDEVDRQAGESAQLPFIVGEEQGAIMALAIAAAVPDLISGVVAIDAILPDVPGWDPPLAPMVKMPVLLINPRALTADGLAQTLERWGASVSVIDTSNEESRDDRIRDWIATQPIRTIRS